jgi:hypothetical protein
MKATLNATDVVNGVRTFSATVNGIRYDIPEAWAMGFCLAHGGDARDAALAWHEQAQLEAQRS